LEEFEGKIEVSITHSFFSVRNLQLLAFFNSRRRGIYNKRFAKRKI